MTMWYTGIGSRNTPPEVLEQMQSIARQLAELGFGLRSGRATGADAAFQKGATEADGIKVIYIPEAGFGDPKVDTKDNFVVDGELRTIGMAYAKSVHRKWSKVSEYGTWLHARNMCQVYGHTFENGVFIRKPSDFVLYWAPEENGIVKGGTATAVMLARKAGVLTINMAQPDWQWRLTCALNVMLGKEVQL